MARFGGLTLAAAIAVLAAARMTGAQADTVQGTATVNAAKIVLTSGMAVSYTSPTGPLVSVLLSDKAPDRQAFAADTKTGPGEPLVPGLFEGAWKSQHIGKKLSGFAFSIRADKKILSEEFLVGGRNNTFSLSGDEYIIELKSTTPRAVGRIRTKTPIVDAGSTKAGLDATFDLAVEPRR